MELNKGLNVLKGQIIWTMDPSESFLHNTLCVELVSDNHFHMLMKDLNVQELCYYTLGSRMQNVVCRERSQLEI